MVKYVIADASVSETLVKLWTDSFRQAYKNVHTPENIETYCRQNFSIAKANEVLSAKTVTCILALRDEMPVGLSVFQHHGTKMRQLDRPSELKQLYILSSEYGSGLGKAMIEHSFSLMRDADKDWVWLCVSDLNYRAQKFYRKMGFKQVGKGPVLEVGTDRLPSSIMCKKL